MELGRVGCAVATSRSVPARVRVRVCVSALAFVCLYVPGSQSSIAFAHDEIAVTGSVRNRVGSFQKRIWFSTL
jgi:hypothetical protein